MASAIRRWPGLGGRAGNSNAPSRSPSSIGGRLHRGAEGNARQPLSNHAGLML